ncbi:MAG: ABC transporter permease [Simkaniaceae bacterium]|nr:ABC transporter permease [Simkaniaceae bacterium]
MKVLTDLRLLFARKAMETLRNPVFLFMGVFTPIIYLALFAPLLKNLSFGHAHDSNILNMFVPGMLTLVAFSVGLFSGFGIIDELRSGIIERLRVTPASRFSLIGGHIFRDMTAALFQVIFFVLIAIPFGFRPDFFGLLLMFILLMSLCSITSAFGNTVGLLTKTEDHFAPIVHSINLPIMLLSGMLLPLSLAPKWLQVAAHFNPVYYVVEASRHLVRGEITLPIVGYAFAFVIPLAAISLLWASRTVSKAVH